MTDDVNFSGSRYVKNIKRNLARMGLTFEDFQQKYKYAGGNKKQHLKYSMLIGINISRIGYRNACLCDHYIEENCYIQSTEKELRPEFLVLGNCCIKRFLPKDSSGRTCAKCKQPHKNRKRNLCNNCKPTPKQSRRANRHWDQLRKRFERGKLTRKYVEEYILWKKQMKKDNALYHWKTLKTKLLEFKKRELKFESIEIAKNYKKNYIESLLQNYKWKQFDFWKSLNEGFKIYGYLSVNQINSLKKHQY